MPPISITVRWGGPSDATLSSTYKVERSLDASSWTELAAAQAATSPYVSPSTTLNGAHAYGVATVTLTSATSFSSSGYGWVDGEALIQWTGKSSNDLTGVTWHSGYGTYTTGSAVVEAHENYTDSTTPTNYAVLYRVTHTDGSGYVSAPLLITYYYPPAPSSHQHCVVVVTIGSDLGIERQAIQVNAYINQDTQFGLAAGEHLDKNAVSSNTATTNALGITCFQCWKTNKRTSTGAADTGYTFVLDSADDSNKVSITAGTIPDRDWVLLYDIAD